MLGTQVQVKRLGQQSLLNLVEKVIVNERQGNTEKSGAQKKHTLRVLSESQVNIVWKQIAFRGKEEDGKDSLMGQLGQNTSWTSGPSVSQIFYFAIFGYILVFSK
jgi:uncharacterized protein YheU (UPF0270 family)